MVRRKLLLACGVLLATVGAVAALLFVPRERAPRSEAQARHTTSRSERSSPPRLSDEASSNPDGIPENRSTRQLTEGTWIHGRVRIPDGDPADDRIEVSAHTVSLEDGDRAVSAVDADGRFLVAFPPEAEEGWLELRSRYLYLEEEVEIDCEDPPGEVVLEPRLGGRVRGELVLPPGASDLAGVHLEILSPTGRGEASPVLRSTILGADLGFDFATLPPRSDYTLSAVATGFVPVQRDLRVAPGAVTEVRIELRAFGRVSGRVTGPDGQPIQRAVVSWRSGSAESGFGPWGRGTATVADGTFSIGSIPPGDLQLLVRSIEFLPELRELGEFASGRALTGLEFRLRSALVRGIVRWPNGSPANDCVVRLTPNSIDPMCLRDPSAWTQDSPREISGPNFSFFVASDGAYRLTARSVQSDERGLSTSSAIAVVDGIRAGEAPLTVVLRPANTVAGRVVDDLGRPVPEFSVRASPSGEAMLSSHENVESPFRGGDGSFALGGLASGTWTLTPIVHGVEGLTSEPLAVPCAASLTLIAPRSVELAGVVLDPTGSPVAAAEVELDSGGRKETDQTGRFEWKHVRSGSIQLVARSKFWAPSDACAVAVAPGEAKTDLVLRLRRGGRIVGHVLDAQGGTDRGIRVVISTPSGSVLDSPTSDAGGRFESEMLLPGTYTVAPEPLGEDPADGTVVEVVEDQDSTVTVRMP